ncbi:MAG: hypothetical protein KBT39_02745 [Bacteroidales bacterium]|nr:hypothetical protein [Bacteroidales bacterium]
MNSSHSIISGEKAREIKSQMLRLISGQLSTEDVIRRENAKILKDSVKNVIVWN